MGLMGNSDSENSPTKNENAIIQSVMEVKKSKPESNDVDVGNEDNPPDCPKDNLFLRLYSDPDTLAPLKRTVYLSRHGESMFNLSGKIGGNASLSANGQKYSVQLAKHFEKLGLADFHVWISELQRTHQTVESIKGPKTVVPQLNEILSGDFDGMTYEEIADSYPIEFAERDQDKLRYRYPGGESYVDVCKRLCEVLPIMNKSNNLLVVSHQAVVRCIYAYLMKLPIEELPYVKIPLHTVMKVTFSNGRNIIQKTKLNVECVDTHREKPSNCSSERNYRDAIQTVPKHQ